MCKVGSLQVYEHEEVGTLAWRKRGPVREVVLPPFTPFSGLTIPALAETDVHGSRDPLNRVARHLDQEFDRVRLHLPPEATDARALQWAGWQVSPLYTYLISVAAGQAAWSSGSRRAVRKEASTFQVVEDAGRAQEVVRLVLDGYERNGRALAFSSHSVTEAASGLLEAGLGRCLVALRDGQAEAGVVFLVDGPRAWYWLAGSKPGPAMTVLMASALEKLGALGVTDIDMVGANTATIAEFKRRLGGRLVPYWAATRSTGLVARGVAALAALRGR
ncbi:MAG: GNAT family N-acetyltransferase [Rhodothermales bacterium]|nr:GNAT family N-acetyltransferase [Rhodothermales bacterium]